MSALDNQGGSKRSHEVMGALLIFLSKPFNVSKLNELVQKIAWIKKIQLNYWLKILESMIIFDIWSNF